MSTIKDLNPKPVWEIFYQITRIPRPSKKEGKAVKFAKEFGEKLGLKTIVDEVGNVIISKPAFTGMENKMGVILQGHLDMVPQKNSDKVHDFENDPIETIIDGNWVKANGTTLGSDNGIGVACALAVLQDKNIKNGPLEVLLTIDEETGMSGAFGLNPGLLRGDILLNLDSEDEGELYIGCAGGMNSEGTLVYKETTVPSGMLAFRLSVTGLKGGHSGLDINLGRGNATKIMNRLLWSLQDVGMRISNFAGGNLRNAIPRESFAIVCIPGSNIEKFIALITENAEIVKSEYAVTEQGFSIKAEKVNLPEKVMDEQDQQKIIRLIYSIPHGVVRMSDEMHGIVETSTNMAIVNAENGNLTIICLLRSSVDSAKLSLGNMTQSVMELAGMKVIHDGSYPGWKPNLSSPILNIMKDLYNKKYGKVPDVKVIHAGLECGIIGAIYPKMDLISFGPTIRFPHSPDEKVNIDSVGKFWDYLVETLEKIPIKK